MYFEADSWLGLAQYESNNHFFNFWYPYHLFLQSWKEINLKRGKMFPFLKIIDYQVLPSHQQNENHHKLEENCPILEKIYKTASLKEMIF